MILEAELSRLRSYIANLEHTNNVNHDTVHVRDKELCDAYHMIEGLKKEIDELKGNQEKHKYDKNALKLENENLYILFFY